MSECEIPKKCPCCKGKGRHEDRMCQMCVGSKKHPYHLFKHYEKWFKKDITILQKLDTFGTGFWIGFLVGLVIMYLILLT